MVSMASKPLSWSDRLFHPRVLRRWKRHARRAATLPADNLSALRCHALDLRYFLNEVIRISDLRRAGLEHTHEATARPPGTDWFWSPLAWQSALPEPARITVENDTVICDGMKLFHDCPRTEISLFQRPLSPASHAPYMVDLEVYAFEGTFLSLVLDLPGQGVQGLTRQHLICLHADIHMEKPAPAYIRLNVKHGPNYEQLVYEIPAGTSQPVAEFDLAGSKLNERKVERAWVDIIFGDPGMNHTRIRDLRFSRRLRADF